MRVCISWLKVHDVTRASIVFAAAALSYLVLGNSTIVEFFSPLPSPIPLSLLIPAIAGVGVGIGCGSSATDFEKQLSTALIVPRAVWAMTVTLAGFIPMILIALLRGGTFGDAQEILRNTLLFSAISLPVAAFTSSRWCWITPTGYALGCLVFGQDRDNGGREFWWAVAINERPSALAELAILFAYFGATAFFSVRGAREG